MAWIRAAPATCRVIAGTAAPPPKEDRWPPRGASLTSHRNTSPPSPAATTTGPPCAPPPLMHVSSGETPSTVVRSTPSSRPVARSWRATCGSRPALAMKASVPMATAEVSPSFGPRIMAAARRDPGANNRTAPSLVAVISIPAPSPPSAPPRNWRFTTPFRSSTICDAFFLVAIPAAVGFLCFPAEPPGVMTSAGVASAAVAATSSARAVGGVTAGVMKTPPPSSPIFATASVVLAPPAPAAA
mmetsp:Transcript_11613/g.54084  ORF Transcript_11613/g.54084 Transcript_11613/m.54084 type:complete len:243 (-) Transcript_11613:2593-3321(-)